MQGVIGRLPAKWSLGRQYIIQEDSLATAVASASNHAPHVHCKTHKMDLTIWIFLSLFGTYRCTEPQLLTGAELGGKPSQTFESTPKAIDDMTTQSANIVGSSRSSLNREIAKQGTLMRQSSKVMEMETECKLMRSSFAALEKDVKNFKRFGTTGEPNNISDVWEQLKKCHSYVLGLVQVRLKKLEGLDWKMLQASPAEESAKAQEEIAIAPEDFSQSRELPEELLSSILEDWKADWLQRFVTILQSVTFPFVQKDWNEIRQIKVSFEKYVFQSIQFMYKFDFIKQKHLRKFFKSTGTLELTGNHLFDIFQSRNGGFDGYHTFRPDMDFILTNWQTEHLHKILRGLKRSQKGVVLYRALSQTIVAFVNTYKEATSSKAMRIYHSFVDEKFFPALKDWKTKSRNLQAYQPNHDVELTKTIQNMIDYFERPPENTYRNPMRLDYSKSEDSATVWKKAEEDMKLRAEYEKKRMSAEYILNYHLLNWVQTYYIKYDLKNHFRPKQQLNYDLFKKHMNLFRLGMSMQQHINDIQDYSHLIYFNKDNIESLPRQISSGNIKELQRSLEQISLEYTSQEKELKFISDLDSPTSHHIYDWVSEKNIVKSILEIFDNSAYNFSKNQKSSRRNLWLIAIQEQVGVKFKYNYEEVILLEHMRKYYKLEK